MRIAKTVPQILLQITYLILFGLNKVLRKIAAINRESINPTTIISIPYISYYHGLIKDKTAPRSPAILFIILVSSDNSASTIPLLIGSTGRQKRPEVTVAICW